MDRKICFAYFGTVLILVLQADPILSQYTGCDYSLTVTTDSKAIYSPNYSGLYSPGTSCRWMLSTNPGSTIQLSCIDVSLPWSTSCSADRLLISKSGNLQLADAQVYCGTETVDIESTSNKLVVSLQVPYGSYGGRFYCTVQQKECQCGASKKKKIVGGEEILVNEFPMLAALVDGVSGEGIFCGATIITNYHATTAAHCFMGKELQYLALLIGDHDITTEIDTPYSSLLKLSSVKIHESYDMMSKINDIAIVRTATEIVFNPGVGPACLPLKYYGASFVGYELFAVGWGMLDYGEPKSPVPMKVDLPVVNSGQCTQAYPNFASSQLCTFAAGKDTCQCDSGGPLFYTDVTNYRVYLVGIVGYGIACATSKPSVSTKVNDYLEWITANTPEWNYCYQ